MLFVVNPEKPTSCGANNVGVIRVLRDTMLESCLDVKYKNLVKDYTASDYSGVITNKVPYEIEGTTFTILSAINYLVSLNMLKFDPDMVMDFNVIPKENVYTLNKVGRHTSVNLFKRSATDPPVKKLSNRQWGANYGEKFETYEPPLTEEEKEIIEYNQKTRLESYVPDIYSVKSPGELQIERILENPTLEREIDYRRRVERQNLLQQSADNTGID